jgi:hypothetical protein
MKLGHRVTELISKIQKLDRMFIFYFTGHESRPPLKDLKDLKSEINTLSLKMSDSKNTAEKYLVSQLVNKFATYKNKWEKGVRDIEEGRLKPGLHFFGGLGTSLSGLSDLKNQAADIDRKDGEAFRMASVIDEAARKYVEMNKKYTGKKYSTDDVSKMLEKKIDDIKKKIGDKFLFNVYYEDGKVKIKPEKEG